MLADAQEDLRLAAGLPAFRFPASRFPARPNVEAGRPWRNSSRCTWPVSWPICLTLQLGRVL